MIIKSVNDCDCDCDCDCDLCCYRGNCTSCQPTVCEAGKNVHFEMVPETITHTISMDAIVHVTMQVPVKMVIPDGSLIVGEQNAMKQVIESLPTNSRITHIYVEEVREHDWN